MGFVGFPALETLLKDFVMLNFFVLPNVAQVYVTTRSSVQNTFEGQLSQLFWLCVVSCSKISQSPVSISQIA